MEFEIYYSPTDFNKPAPPIVSKARKYILDNYEEGKMHIIYTERVNEFSAIYEYCEGFTKRELDDLTNILVDL